MNRRQSSVTVRILFMLVCLAAPLVDAQINELPSEPPAPPNVTDWLLDPSPYTSGVYKTDNNNEIALSNGLIRRTFRIAPNAATVGFDNLVTGEAILRGVKPEALIEIDGRSYEIGGLKGQPNYAYLLPEWVDELKADPEAFQFAGFEVGTPKERMAWKRVRHHAPNLAWPPKGVSLTMDYSLPKLEGVKVSVHYELYDGIPMMSKWVTVENKSDSSITINRITSEVLAAVELGAAVETPDYPFQKPNIHVETDYAFSSFEAVDANHHTVHWETDPDYKSQVNYLRKTPCLLKVSPELGPEETLAAGETFESIRAFIMPYDTYDRDRQGLAQRRMYRVIAPWVTENPLMMHARFADWDRVKLAIDQASEVGFEMVILTFGSGFNIENDSDEYIAKMKQYADYAHSKGVELGGYSLLASRKISPEHDVVMPEGQKPTFGHSPCLHSQWGHDYFAKLYNFYEKTGFNLLEHDGSYPGDPCMSTEHPGHTGLNDSRWKQFKMISDFYAWCRSEGIYLNVPDYYFLAGSNKCGMGYREVNWSLPRAEQVMHTRQNIYDGSWEKIGSMGWMFVPLTEYHGGGAAATIEPLDEHRDHYSAMMISNLAMGVQACYRGPRLFDTDRTKAMVKGNVDWFKKYRDILESDMIHGRRADGRDVDWMLHVNPDLKRKGMLVVFNPLKTPVTRTLKPNLYYTGLSDTAQIRQEEGRAKNHSLDRDYTVSIQVELPAQSHTWFVIE